MLQLFIQLKTTMRDKMSLLSFFLPIIMAILLNFISEVNINSVTEIKFGVVADELPVKVVSRLEAIGNIESYEMIGELHSAVIEPSDELMGVTIADESVEVLLSGDETMATKSYGENLLGILNTDEEFKVNGTKSTNYLEEFRSLLYSVVIIMAIFIGCTFNSMNMVSEKEDGTINIYSVLPIGRTAYIEQKTILGFVLSILLSMITALFCVGNLTEFVLISVVAILASFFTSLLGLLIGKISKDLIVALSYIKLFMIFLMAVPIVIYIFLKDYSLAFLFNIIPSYPVFLGIMNILNGSYREGILNILILLVYVISVVVIYFLINRFKKLKLRAE